MSGFSVIFVVNDISIARTKKKKIKKKSEPIISTRNSPFDGLQSFPTLSYIHRLLLLAVELVCTVVELGVIAYMKCVKDDNAL